MLLRNMSNINEQEKEILDFWEKNDIFQKSLDKPSPNGDFVFYDGPPFATGTPHYGHFVPSVIKDVIPRYKAMSGYRVERKWGWDCHGLPIENIVEKECGFKSKKDIEKMGVEKFNKSCESKVLAFAEEWKKTISRLGRWADMDDAYKTMDLNYMESVWWAFKELWKKGLIYEGHKSMHICPRCETTLSQQEVSEGYRDVNDISAIAKFKLESGQKIGGEDVPDNTFVLAWTTTPWTLPANVALAVGDDIDYVLVRINKLNTNKTNFNFKEGESYILSENLAKEMHIIIDDNISDEMNNVSVVGGPKDDNEIDINYNLKKIKGRELIGLKYQPLFDYYSPSVTSAIGGHTAREGGDNWQNIYKIVSADFVSTEEGTGVVHIAPAFGEDDLNLGKKENLPFIQNVGEDGKFLPEVKDFAGLSVKPIDDVQSTDEKIIEYLKDKDLLFSSEKYPHSYPHCWRCDTPLINFATTSWFVRVESKAEGQEKSLRERAIELAKKINWFPPHIKEGRFGKWLEGARDWAISRQRFWASAMPVWKCECGGIKVFGSVVELEKESGQKITDIHKHIVDKIEIDCPKCGKKMKRIPDVLDCWFDSGAMPYAQSHYPFENKEKLENDKMLSLSHFVAEATDQTRAWFYYLHILATALMDKPAFENAIVNGMVLAEDGKKMAKKLQNYTAPDIIMEKYGADAVRLYLLSSPVVAAENLNFSDDGVREIYQKVVMLLGNVLNFYRQYRTTPSSRQGRDATPSKEGEFNNEREFESDNILDKWIYYKLVELGGNVSNGLEQYNLSFAARQFIDFANDFSTWWLRLSRPRFKSENEKDKESAKKTFSFVLLELSKLLAPFAPFLAEKIYQELKSASAESFGLASPKGHAKASETRESVHLEEWPSREEMKGEYDSEARDILDKMKATQEAVEIGLRLRNENGIAVKQPLSKLELKKDDFPNGIFEDLAKQELNIKEIVFGDKEHLTTELTTELISEGLLRELVRKINQERKNNNLSIDDKDIILEYDTESDELEKVIGDNEKEIRNSCLCSDISKKKLDDNIKEHNIGDYKIKIRLVK